VTAVGTGDRPGGGVDLVLRDDLDPRAAVAVEHDDLDRRDAGLRRVLLARQDVQAVRRPGGGREDGVLLFGQGAGGRAVGVHEPQVHVAAAIAAEDDGPAVRRIARRVVEGRSRGDAFGLAAGDADAVDV